MKFSTLLFFLTLIYSFTYGQSGLKGTVYDQQGLPLEGVSIQLTENNKGTVTDSEGYFNLLLTPGTYIIELRHVGYNPAFDTVAVAANHFIKKTYNLKERAALLHEISIEDYRTKDDEVSVTRIKPISAESLVTPFGDFNKILTTLPGVVSNNELSSAYSVRGGNFDENLVYVNEIPIYRPFLVSNGQQEGLSFVNTDMVENVSFSAGGWQPKYGDKLASVLNVNYKKTNSFGASASLHLLGGSAHIEGTNNDERLSYVAGIRHKSAQYLLNTLETQGEYLPRFTDMQAFVNYKLNKTTEIGVLASYARNRYLTEPESRETDFGTIGQSFRLFVGFQGQEILQYDTYQGGIKLTKHINDKWISKLIVSGVYGLEREYTDVEGAYRLCDVDKNLSSNSFNECIYIRGIGSNYDYGRNTLEANIINAEDRNVYQLDDKNTLEFGLGYSYQNIKDQLGEYSFRDSSDYVIDIESLQAENNLESNRYTGYVQHTHYFSDEFSATYGARLNYWDVNEELLISPRTQFSYSPKWERDITFNAAVGVYQQQPFYRELRNYQGDLNEDLKAQRSMHIIGGMNYSFKWWDRDFKFISELYYKRIRNVIAYDIDNVKVRYYANNDAKAYASGLDMRLSGEFIPGTESWFSLGILNTREDVDGDGKGYIRRPTDQRVNMAIFFQDHLPSNPTVRVSLNLLYGTGLPFGPPRDKERRNIFNGGSYRRLDVGFSKIFFIQENKYKKERQFIVSAEILNLLGTSNPISYTWVSDVSNNSFAVPNTLSARFLNVKISVKI
ncbi:TonB-dependent receptor [Fulvivirga sediminis]|uniref:TonB-dependent receptor n=1 Tax=Fulvivirga sediminis TaxID=2803949 RepID=A0A937F6G2_9BACT|nr:TonB-dependent receptor [Fulvivirga sediminis]MBL3657302.1 TonB-dependent receptor [Fulvivirga sediminis]